MSQNHLSPRDIPFGKGSRAYWAFQPTGRALVFVHGFGGESVGTWNDFPILLTQTPEFGGYDLIFYGYDGLYTQANASAAQIGKFLGQLLSAPATVFNQTVRPDSHRPATFDYTSVV